jgi:NADH-ubiquinone oxidoreductase chain 4L
MLYELLNFLHFISNPIGCVACSGFVLFLFAFVSKRKHILATLLSLEGLMVTVFMLMCLFRAFFGGYHVFILLFLTLVACEGALGLSLLISIVRGHRSDYFSSLNLL